MLPFLAKALYPINFETLLIFLNYSYFYYIVY